MLLWAWGYDGFVVIDLLCRAGRIVMGRGVGLGEYGKCIMHFGFGFVDKYFFCFTITCYCNPFVIIVLSVLRHPRAQSII